MDHPVVGGVGYQRDEARPDRPPPPRQLLLLVVSGTDCIGGAAAVVVAASDVAHWRLVERYAELWVLEHCGRPLLPQTTHVTSLRSTVYGETPALGRISPSRMSSPSPPPRSVRDSRAVAEVHDGSGGARRPAVAAVVRRILLRRGVVAAQRGAVRDVSPGRGVGPRVRDAVLRLQVVVVVPEERRVRCGRRHLAVVEALWWCITEVFEGFRRLRCLCVGGQDRWNEEEDGENS